MNKNEIFETEITDLSDKGMGIGRVNGMTVFVKDAAVGDRVKAKITCAKKTYAYAIIEEFVKPSEDRITPDCPVFSKCGGCALRHISYASELDFKQRRVAETMKRIGHTSVLPQPIISASPDFYRNKAQYPVSAEGIGFYAAHSHRVVPTAGCLLSPPEFSRAANAFWDFIKQNGISVYSEEAKTGLVRHFCMRKGLSSGEIQAVAVINGKKLPGEDRLADILREVLGDSLKSFVINENRLDTNVIYGNSCRTVWGSDSITDTLCGIKVRLSPLSFYQVNSVMAEKLYLKAAEYAAPKGKTVLDLYCGTGTIGLSMANTAKEIIGVEVVPEAVRDAEANAKANGITNARFICKTAAQAVKELKKENLSPDVVILDPPRKGCDEAVLTTVAKGFCPERIVYISCNVATLARDTAILEGLGYTLVSYTPADLFPRTSHVETVVLMSRVK